MEISQKYNLNSLQRCFNSRGNSADCSLSIASIRQLQQSQSAIYLELPIDLRRFETRSTELCFISLVCPCSVEVFLSLSLSISLFHVCLLVSSLCMQKGGSETLATTVYFCSFLFCPLFIGFFFFFFLSIFVCLFTRLTSISPA